VAEVSTLAEVGEKIEDTIEGKKFSKLTVAFKSRVMDVSIQVTKEDGLVLVEVAREAIKGLLDKREIVEVLWCEVGANKGDAAMSRD
jgi:hypothetical protein